MRNEPDFEVYKLYIDNWTKNMYGFSASMGDNCQMSLSQENGIIALGFSTGMLILWDIWRLLVDICVNKTAVTKFSSYLLFAEYSHKKKIH